eukprot:2646901-Rhodomonas_salina.2
MEGAREGAREREHLLVEVEDGLTPMRVGGPRAGPATPLLSAPGSHIAHRTSHIARDHKSMHLNTNACI